MVLGYHVIIGAYGFWLPNDPRGSWSNFVGSRRIARFGRATKVDTHCSLAAKPHDRDARLAAKQALKYPTVRFDGVQARAVGRGFAELVEKSTLTVWALSILPRHVHLVVARHRYRIEQLVNLLKGAATRQLIREGIHPSGRFASGSGRPPKAWARNGWHVFLDTEEDIRRSIRYVEQNPLKEDKPRRHWWFVTPFGGGSPVQPRPESVEPRRAGVQPRPESVEPRRAGVQPRPEGERA